MPIETEKQKAPGRPALGRGLSSLLNVQPVPTKPATAPVKTEAAETTPSQRIPGITFLPVKELMPFEYQPRREFRDETIKELAESIKEKGVIQPIIVRKSESGYQIIAGERRWRASKLAGLIQVPVVLTKASDREAMEMAIIENVQRENLNPVDEALAYFQLMEDFKMSQEEVAKRVGKDRSTVANLLRLLKLPDVVLNDLKNNKISLGHAKVLLSVADQNTLLQTREKILERQLSVRDTELLLERIKQLKEAKPTEGEPEKQSRRWRRVICERFEKSLGVPVRATGLEEKGKLTLTWTSKDQLNRMLDALDRAK